MRHGHGYILSTVANEQGRGAEIGPVPQLSRKNHSRSSRSGNVLLSVGEDFTPLEDYTHVSFHCEDLKTWDGVCLISQGLFDRTGEAERTWSLRLHKRIFLSVKSLSNGNERTGFSWAETYRAQGDETLIYDELV